MANKQITEAEDKEFNEYINSIRDGEDVTEDSEVTETDKIPEEAPEEAPPAAEEEIPQEASEQTFTQDDINRIMGEEKAKWRREGEGSMQLLRELGAEAQRFYGAESEEESIRQMIDDLRNQNAENAGLSSEEYDAHNEMERKAREYDSMQQARQQYDDEVTSIRERWAREEEEIKEVYPDFDFRSEMEQNEAFKNAVLQGKSLPTAYMSTRKSAVAEEKPSRKEVMQNGANPTLSSTKGGFDPTSASDEEFNRYIQNIRRQE